MPVRAASKANGVAISAAQKWMRQYRLLRRARRRAWILSVMWFSFKLAGAAPHTEGGKRKRKKAETEFKPRQAGRATAPWTRQIRGWETDSKELVAEPCRHQETAAARGWWAASPRNRHAW